MTVTCPECSRRYRVPAGAAKRRDTTFRCTKCRHVFALEAARDEPTLLDVQDDGDDDDRTVRLDDEIDVPEDDFDDDEDGDDAPPPRRKKKAAAKAERRTRRAPAGDDAPPSVARFALRAMLAVIAVYGIVSIYFSTNPDGQAKTLGRIPVIGSDLTEQRLSPQHLQLTNVKGEFIRVHGGQVAFIVTGTATNNAPVPVRTVQVQARLLGEGEQRRSIFCGTEARDIGQLSLHEIALLQTLEPPKDWTLPSGAHTSFTIVFAQPKLPIREFDVEVVAVRGV